jgi:hypothetical protein
LPVTSEDVENCVDESNVKAKPVRAPDAMGETAMLPVIEVLGPAEIPLDARMAYLQADPRSIGK